MSTTISIITALRCYFCSVVPDTYPRVNSNFLIVRQRVRQRIARFPFSVNNNRNEFTVSDTRAVRKCQRVLLRRCIYLHRDASKNMTQEERRADAWADLLGAEWAAASSEISEKLNFFF